MAITVTACGCVRCANSGRMRLPLGERSNHYCFTWSRHRGGVPSCAWFTYVFHSGWRSGPSIVSVGMPDTLRTRSQSDKVIQYDLLFPCEILTSYFSILGRDCGIPCSVAMRKSGMMIDIYAHAAPDHRWRQPPSLLSSAIGFVSLPEGRIDI